MSILFPRTAVLAIALLPCLAVASSLSLDTAIQLALQRSEATRAARASALGAVEASRAAAQLPDPTLRIGVDNLPATGRDRFHTAHDSMTMKRIGISQEWLSADKRAARQAAANATLDRETAQIQAATAEARLQTALVYLDAFYTGETLKLAMRTQQHAEQELQASQARFSSATGSSQEVLALAGAQGTTEDEAADIQQQHNNALIALERWIGVQPGTLLPPGAMALPTEDGYVAGSPSVTTLQRDLGVAQQSAHVTASNRSPNWTWELAYSQRTGYADMVSVGVSIPLPVAPGARQDRDTAAKLAWVTKAEADLAEATRSAAAEYRSLVSDTQRLQQRIDRYRTGVLAPAEQRTSTATAAYRSNQGSLVAVFEARHAAVEAQRKLLVLQRDLARTQMQLAFRPLTAEVAR